MLDNKWDSIRVYVTERCNAKCSNCFNASSRNNQEMDVKTFEKLCFYLSSNGIEKIKLLGGEPTIHDNFVEIIRIAQNNFKYIGVFTNGIFDNFSNIELRDTDSIIYNSNFLHLFNSDVFHWEQKGLRVIELQILKDTSVSDVIKMIEQIEIFDKKRFLINITLDCKSNIFLEKDIILPKLYLLENFLIDANINFSYDHKLPFCYLYKTKLHIKEYGICSLNSSGVIDAKLNLRFCLQNTDVLLSIYNGNKFIPWKIIENNLRKEFLKLRMKALHKICDTCIFYEDKCNGGCWVSQDFIMKEDILLNTNFPLK